MDFKVKAPYEPAGDQGPAIEALSKALTAGESRVTLEGVTGVGKTFIMAKTIEAARRPTLIICHNKTLAAQLYEEMKAFFPDNEVHYFVSYYDYYQPEAYVPQSDTYIAKESDVNKEIEKLRHAATQAIMTRDDVVVVSSVSCIYGLGDPEEYFEGKVYLKVGEEVPRKQLVRSLVDVYYERNDAEVKPGTFRVRGDTIDVLPPGDEDPIRIELWGDEIEAIKRVHRTTGETLHDFEQVFIFPAKHFVMDADALAPAIARIESQLAERLRELRGNGNILEAARLEQRTRFDIEMISEIGYCNGIENYSQPLSGRPRGDPGACLLDYFEKPPLIIMDESHVTVPQVRGMYNGDRQRKQTLVDFGFRLPSALDNRPLKFHEFERKADTILFTSATPGPYEKEKSTTTVPAIVRPTGLLDPVIEVRPVMGQVDDLYSEIKANVAKGQRVLVTTLTKRMAEELTQYYQGLGVKVAYLHSDIDTLDRVIILEQLRNGEFDVLVGINLLREGLDLPEVSLVAIFDADKIGFLRSATSLIQTVGRAARHLDGRVIMYADRMSDAMEQAIEATNERRKRQQAYNEAHGITPKSVRREVKGIQIEGRRVGEKAPAISKERLSTMDKSEFDKLVKQLEDEMKAAAKSWDFERAAELRDLIVELKAGDKPAATPSKRQAEAAERIKARQTTQDDGAGPQDEAAAAKEK